MAKQNREVTDKKHKVRRAFIISTIVAGVLTAGAAAMAAFSASPILIAIDCAILTCAAFVAVGSGVSINKIRDSAIVALSKNEAKKSLEKIKMLDKDNSSTYSNQYRAKVVKKFANANLKLSARRGGTSFGMFKSSCGLQNEKAIEVLTQIDSYTLLRDVAQNNAQKKKYSKKLSLAEKKISKIIEEEGITASLQRWTKSYDNVVSGASVLDRRTEIACLTNSAKEAFANTIGKANETTDNKAGYVVVNFNSNIRPTMARIEDQTKIEEVKRILFSDVYEACKSKSASEVRGMFPITLEAKVIDKETTTILSNYATTVNNLSGLQAKINELSRTK